jgi:hypothetical protein
MKIKQLDLCIMYSYLRFITLKLFTLFYFEVITT